MPTAQFIRNQMSKPSLNVVNEFKKIEKSFPNTSLNWCEKRKAWGVLGYEFNIGSYWIAFILLDRKRK